MPREGVLGLGILPLDAGIIATTAGAIFGFALGFSSGIAFLAPRGALLAGLAGAIAMGGVAGAAQEESLRRLT